MVKDPLRKRYIRELKGDLGKYLVIFFLLLLSIAEISGFLVADTSMIAAYNESFEKYNIENGNFTVDQELSLEQKEKIEGLGVSVYDLQSFDKKLADGNVLRIFSERTEINLVCLMEGDLPKTEKEIAIDRMYADNNGLTAGDEVVLENDRKFTISGLVALSDYSTMFEDNSDMMFDAKTFGVAIVAPEAFNSFDKELITWRYAWKYDQQPAGDAEENSMSEDFLKSLTSIVSLSDYIPRYQNQAIIFTGEDMEGDGAMMTIFLYIIIVIIAFVFGVTISNTIIQESNVIGTLRATGYTRREIVRHYMAMPVMITVIAAIIGNILGYTVLKNVNANLYYGSYSLPTYVTLWSAEAFIKTTVIPLVLMVVITWAILTAKLKLSPLKFLRRDLKKHRKRGAVSLSKKIPFFTRFRLRIVFENIGNYVMLLVGIAFANFLLLFGLMMPSVLHNYSDSLPENMFCSYQYILKVPASVLSENDPQTLMLLQQAVSTETPDAEKFSVYSLKTVETEGFRGDEIILYGIAEDSKYIDIDFEPGKVYISSTYADKWELEKGDNIELKEPYSDGTYSFKIGGIFDYNGGLCIFMPQDELNKMFDLGDGFFAGYFSDTRITDIEEKYIGKVIDIDALSKISRQLDISMGGMMRVVSVFAILIYLILIYLLSKTIIEKNASSISMTKIIGYTNAEIARLYVMVTSILVVIFLVITIPAMTALMTYVFRVMIRIEMTGWIPFILDKIVYVKMVVYGLAAYAVVAVLEYIKIGKVPMEEALKDAE